MTRGRSTPATVFLDRDGVINRKRPEGDYVKALEEFEFLPGSIDAIVRLSRAGKRTVVVTNQQGIAKGIVSPADLDVMHDALRAAVRHAGGELTDILVCPHLEGTCACRKPLTGLFEEARSRHPDISFPDSVVVGDSATDIAAAHAIGAWAIRVSASPSRSRAPGMPIEVVSLADAADLILEGEGSRTRERT